MKIGVALFMMVAGVAGAMTPQARQKVEADWTRQEQIARKLSCGSAAALDGVLSRGAGLVADMREAGATLAVEQAVAVLTEVRNSRSALSKEGGQTDASYRALYMKARWALRELAFGSPAIDFNEILFVKRQWPRYGHQCSHRVGEAQIPGANHCVLRGLSPDGEVRGVLSPEMAKGGVGRFDLSFDATRIVFPYARPRPKPTKYGAGLPGVRGGACIMYDIYEVGIDGTGLRQLTDNPDSEDTEPVYLPDGRIGFTSSRDNRYVQCGDWALVCGLHSMAADGSDVRRITEPQDGEFYPSMLDDGRILYSRWDYVMKAYNVIQQLWTVNPDGRAAALAFGDHYAFSVGPIAFYEARQVPGTRKVICTGAAHHNTCVGPVMMVDLDQNRGNGSAMVNLTPELGYPEIVKTVLDEVVYEKLPGQGMSNHKNPTGWYSSPYPLSETQFLVVSSFEELQNACHGYGLYLMDVHHNRELIYRFPQASCYSPFPLRPRKKPLQIADMVSGVDPATPGRFIVTDVYQGLPGVKRGAAKYLRVLESLPKTGRTTPQRCDVGFNSGWDHRAVLGTVPIEEDGSAHFLAPTGKLLFFEVLDKDHLEIRRMRNYVNIMPGEVNSCVGCHEPYGSAPMQPLTRPPRATLRAPSTIMPPPWGTEGMSFQKVVQPVLDQHCVQCHDGGPPSGRYRSAVAGQTAVDLRGKRWAEAPIGYDKDHQRQHMVTDAFLNLLKHVSYVRVGNYQGEKLPLAPYATGSSQSRLMRVLKDGHYNVKLGIDAWRALAAWIDCNAPFYGDRSEIMLAHMVPSTPTPLRTQSAADRDRIAARVKTLSSAAAPTLLAYLDCGLQIHSDKGRAAIKQISGKGWTYRGSEAVTNAVGAHRDITYHPKEVVFEISGLAPGIDHAVHLSWWDFNSDARHQSIWVQRPGSGKRECIRKRSRLPSYLKRGELPETMALPLPAAAIVNGKTRLIIQCEGGSNAVVGEVWVTAR